MITGVYAKENFEIAISKQFKVIHYLIDDNYGVKLYKDNKLIAIVERKTVDRIKAKYAFINDKENCVCNDIEFSKLLVSNNEYVDVDLSGMFLKDTIVMDEEKKENPKVSNKGITECLKTWTLGIYYQVTESRLFFEMQTTSLSYVIIIENDNIYCGISLNIPFEKGLFGGGQYFRIRDYNDNSAPFCWWICNLGGKIKKVNFDKDVNVDGQCIISNEGIYWLLKSYTDDEIILQGCNGDEYRYYRNKNMIEYFK